MAERAHPDLKGFKDKFFGLIKSKYKENLFKRYLFCNKYIKNKIILDIPCGMGWGTSLLKKYKLCYGIDIDKDSIIEANKRFKRGNLKFTQGNMTSIDFGDNFFNVVICLEGIEHITYREGQKFLLEARRILKKNGLLIVSSPILRKNKFHSGNPYHLCEYKEGEFIEIFTEKKLKIIKKRYLKTSENTRILIMVAKKL